MLACSTCGHPPPTIHPQTERQTHSTHYTQFDISLWTKPIHTQWHDVRRDPSDFNVSSPQIIIALMKCLLIYIVPKHVYFYTTNTSSTDTDLHLDPSSLFCKTTTLTCPPLPKKLCMSRNRGPVDPLRSSLFDDVSSLTD